LATKFGFIDTSGEFAIPPIYDGVGEFREGRAVVRRGTRMGYVSRDGHEIIPCQYGGAADFSGGLAAVTEWDAELAAPTMSRERAYAIRQKKKPVGYINRAGERVIDPSFIFAGEFSEGVADVEYDIGKWGFADAEGNIRPVEAGCLYGFREGRARFETGDLRRGFLDTELRVVIPPIYKGIYDFHEGLAWATEEYGQVTSHFLNPAGERVLTFDTYCDDEFSEGLLAVRSGNLWGFVNKSGEQVIPPISESAGNGFQEGMASVQCDGKWGCIDVEGAMVIEPRFDWSCAFSEGLAWVSVGGTSGFVNVAGDLVFETRCQYVGAFHEGLAAAEIALDVARLAQA
jgi:hypothetical protein